MTNVVRVALPGYNAETDTDLDHFALYTDQDNVLIKEKTRGSISVAGGGGTQTITHSLGYVPFWAVYANGEWVYGNNIYGDYKAYATTTTLVLRNNNASARTFLYYIFYDQQV